MSLVIYGGSFDPPHLGHKMIVDTLKELNLGTIVIVPNTTPDYKASSIANNFERIKMLELMFNEHIISDFEVNNHTYTPSIKTIKHFKKQSDNLYFVMGSDSYNNLHTWHNYEEIINNVIIIVIKRDNEVFAKCNNVIFINNDIIDISSTSIRKNICKDHLHDAVYNYIKENNIYATTNS